MSSTTFLVTGANGYIGLHIIKMALEKGYNVIGTVRSESSAQTIKDTFPEYTSPQLSTAIVKDITSAEQYKDVLDGVTAIIHTASPFSFAAKDMKKEILDPAVAGAVAILEAAHKYGPSVNRVVSTSSFASIVNLGEGNREGYTYTEKDWNPMTYEVAATKDAVTAYAASKGLAEKAQWEWMEKNKPSFGFTSINPGWVFGPNVVALPISKLGQSSTLLWELLDAKEVPAPDFRNGVDVRDVTAAHVLAATNPKASGERFLLGQTFSWQKAADAIRESMPELKSRVPIEGPNSKTPGYEVDGSKSATVLGFTYTPLTETVKDSLTQYLNESLKA